MKFPLLLTHFSPVSSSKSTRSSEKTNGTKLRTKVNNQKTPDNNAPNVEKGTCNENHHDDD